MPEKAKTAPEQRPKIWQINMVDSSDSVPERKFVRQLEIAIADLWWLSESEYPFQVIYWQDLANCDLKVRLQRQYPPETKIATQEFSSFFAAATREETWHNQEEQTEVKRYQALVNLLTENLTELKVYLVGEVEIDAYILGKMDRKAIAGLMTNIVAT